MTQEGKLFIGIIMNTMQQSMQILDSIYKMEKANNAIVYTRSSGILTTDNAVYRVINQSKYEGYNLDQLIIDYSCYRPEIVNSLLFRSCVPPEYQIIDEMYIW